jgi:hypothetical protein
MKWLDEYFEIRIPFLDYPVSVLLIVSTLHSYNRVVK